MADIKHITSKNLDLNKFTTNKYSAASGTDFVSIDASYLTGDLVSEKQDNGTYLIRKNGVPMGYIKDIETVELDDKVTPVKETKNSNANTKTNEIKKLDIDTSAITKDGYKVISSTNNGSTTIVGASKNGSNSKIFVYDNSGKLVGSFDLNTKNEIANIEYKNSDGVLITYTDGTVRGVSSKQVIGLINDKKKADAAAAAAKAAEQRSRGVPALDGNGMMIRTQSAAGQDVINGLFAAGTANAYHSPELNAKIDALSPEECAWVLERIEGPGLGQTGDGLAGSDSAYSDSVFIDHQLNTRYGGDIHNLIKAWGTYSYSGY